MHSNCEIWKMAECGEITEGEVIEDQEGNQLVFTGKSFQPIEDSEDRYVGMCVGDVWRRVGIFDDLYDAQ